MLERILPRQLDNNYKGWRTALWLLGVVTLVRLLQSVMIIFNAENTVRGADGIPLETYPADAAQNVVALFGQNSLWRALFCLLGVVVLVRYRSAVTLMFTALLLHYVSALLLAIWTPLVKVGNPPGPWVNRVIVGMMVVGLVLSILRRTE